ncbi:hypothetical protein [Naasia aerilata]|nr:hypothetical protein [Naasia aerilata]
MDARTAATPDRSYAAARSSAKGPVPEPSTPSTAITTRPFG